MVRNAVGGPLPAKQDEHCQISQISDFIGNCDFFQILRFQVGAVHFSWGLLDITQH